MNFRLSKISFLVVALIFCGVQRADSQVVVTGFVEDMSGNPIEGAFLHWEEGGTVVGITDTAGRFRAELPAARVGEKRTLVARCPGYLSLSFPVKDDTRTLRIQLETDALNLEGVVITGTRTPKSLKDAPIITRVISAQDIAKVDATDVGELLQQELPGIEFTYSMNQQTSLNMCGFGGTNVLFLVDGERMAGETLDNIDYSRLNLDNVQSIEIVKGAASSLYGSNAVGGVVNLISREAAKPWSVNVNARYGSHNNQRYGASVGFRTKRWNSLTSFQYNSCGDVMFPDPKVEGEQNAYEKIYAFRTLNFKERLSYEPIQRLKFTARAGYFFRERFSSETANDRYRDFSGGLKANYRFIRNADIELAYSFDQYDKSDFLHAFRSDVRDYSNVQNSIRVLYNQRFFRKFTFTIGADYLYDYLLSYMFVDGGSESQHNIDGFLQLDYEPTQAWEIIGAVRYDYFSEFKASLDGLTGKLSGIYKKKFPNGQLSLRGSYSGGFRAPTLKELYMVFDMASIFTIYGNQNLKPQTSHNFQLSLEYSRAKFNVAVSGFYNIVDNSITTTWNKELNGMQYVNIQKMDVVGAELSLNARFDYGFGASASYAYTYEHFPKGVPLTTSTRPHALTAKVTYDHAWKKVALSVVLSGRYMSGLTSDEYTSLTDLTQTTRVHYPGYTIWRFNTSVTFWQALRLHFTIDNLFNYIPKVYYSNSPQTVGISFSGGFSLDIDQFNFKKNKKR